MNYVTKPIPDSKPPVSRVERPWGSFSQYAFNQDVTVSLMEVEPGKRLSQQSHTARGELWTVFGDGEEVLVGDEIFQAKTGDEFWIPANTKHRLVCRSPQLVLVLETTFGNWQQADITRYEDDFNHPELGE